MRRYLAIRVERPRRGFATLVRLRGNATGRRGFTPLTSNQTVADVKFYQIDRRGRGRHSRKLRTVRIEGLATGPRRGDALTIEARYDGEKTVHIEISEHGTTRERISLSVEREPRGRWWLLVLSGLVLVGFLGWFVFGRPALSGDGGRREDVGAVGSGAGGIQTGDGGSRVGASSSRLTETEASSAEGGSNASSGAARDETAEPESASPSVGGTEDRVPPVESASRSSTGTEQADEPSVRPIAAERPSQEPLQTGEEGPLPQLGDGGRGFTVYFEPDSTELTPTTRRRLAELVAELEAYPGYKVEIVGHAAPYGNEAGRSGISRGRALAVRDLLLETGWQPAIEPIVQWRGATEPVTRTIRDQYLNRRVEIRFVESAND